MPDWKSPETLERLIASLIAANGGKTDNQQIARLMNETYDAIENRTRVYKKAGQKLVQEAEDSGRINQDMRKRGNASPRKERATPKKAAGTPHGVASGRVTKTPTKKKSPVKQEIVSSDSSVFDDGAVDTPATAESFYNDMLAGGAFNTEEWANNDFA